jgi:hypothetical protein
MGEVVLSGGVCDGSRFKIVPDPPAPSPPPCADGDAVAAEVPGAVEGGGPFARVLDDVEDVAAVDEVGWLAERVGSEGGVPAGAGDAGSGEEFEALAVAAAATGRGTRHPTCRFPLMPPAVRAPTGTGYCGEARTGPSLRSGLQIPVGPVACHFNRKWQVTPPN